MKTMKDAMKAHKAAGGYFFDPDTMRFWESQVYDRTWEPLTGLFITSEGGPLADDGIMYAVRQMDTVGFKHIATYGRYDTLEEAEAALRLRSIHDSRHGMSEARCGSCGGLLTRAEVEYCEDAAELMCGVCLAGMRGV